MKPKEIVIAFLIKKNCVFMGVREKAPFTGFWEFPGGKVERNETKMEAICREVLEECGIVLHEVHKGLAINATSHSKNLHIQSFIVFLKDAEIVSDVYNTWSWFPINKELKKLNHLEANEPFLDYLLNDFLEAA